MAENRNHMPENIICPRKLFGYDLKELISKKTALGHQIIVCGDFNSDYDELTTWMQDMSLVDLIRSRHNRPPITYQRSARDAIDCILGSPSLLINNGGFLSFNRLLSDHRGIWLDIPKELMYG